MARRKKAHAAENHERWLISYADFITLLFAFFVVMFASSQADKGRAAAVSESVRKALDGEKVKTVMQILWGGSVDNVGKGNAMMRGPGGANKSEDEQKKQKLAELVPSLKVLSDDLKKEIDAGRISVSMEQRGLVVSFNQAALFPSGEDTVLPGGSDGLMKVASAVGKLPNPIRLEGHTDAIPISTSRFHSNWELSAARSIAVMEILAKNGVPREHMSIAGYADVAPIATNDTEEGRARNRRVDIVILNEQGMVGEPSKLLPAKQESGQQEAVKR